MALDKSSYRHILKVTSIFGGLQFFQIVASILRSKFIAIFLGPYGMGIAALFLSGIEIVTSISNFGLSTSGVKFISEKFSTGNDEEVKKKFELIKKLSWFTGFIGFLILLIFSSHLSQILFGNKNYSWSFALLSITLLFNQISEGYLIIFRGMREVKFLSRASFFGTIIGLFTSIPFYYFLGVDGIVPSMISASGSILFFNFYFANKLYPTKDVISFNYAYVLGKKILSLGFLVSLTGVITILSSNIVKIFISKFGSLQDVGFYNAGFSIINTYVGLIFTSMSVDYFPRLSGVSNNILLSRKIVNQQAEISLLLLSPIILIFIIFSKTIIFFLYSDSFYTIQYMIVFAALGTLFKALSWSFAFLILTKGSNKIFIINELGANAYFLPLNLYGYHFYGLTGLGVSYLISYILYSIQTYFVLNIYFGFLISKSVICTFSIQLLLVTLSMFFLNIYILDSSFFIALIILVISLLFSVILLYKRVSD